MCFLSTSWLLTKRALSKRQGAEGVGGSGPPQTSSRTRGTRANLVSSGQHLQFSSNPICVMRLAIVEARLLGRVFNVVSLV